MATDKKKVVFGLVNVYYALWNESEGTYGTPVRLRGGVKMAITREGNSSKFYADDEPYVSFETNAGYTGELEMAYVDAQALMDLVGYEKDSHGAIIEATDQKAKPFALLYEVESNLDHDRFCFYNCTVSRPEGEANTTTDSTDPDTQTLNVTMIPREFEWGTGGATKKVVKSYISDDSEGAATYAGWFSTVLVPTKASA